LEIGVCRDQVVGGSVVQDLAVPGSSKSVQKITLGFRKEVTQQYDQFWRETFVEEELHLPETLFLAASSAA
jgi:hypothetical protein